MTCCSGTAASPRCSSVPASASALESSSRSSSSSDAHGPPLLASVLALAEHGRSVTTSVLPVQPRRLWLCTHANNLANSRSNVPPPLRKTDFDSSDHKVEERKRESFYIVTSTWHAMALLYNMTGYRSFGPISTCTFQFHLCFSHPFPSFCTGGSNLPTASIDSCNSDMSNMR